MLGLTWLERDHAILAFRGGSELCSPVKALVGFFTIFSYKSDMHCLVAARGRPLCLPW